MKRFLGWLALSAATGWLAVGALFWVSQEALIFPAPKISRHVLDQRARDAGVSVVSLRSAEGNALMAWFLPSPLPQKRVILYFHGNGSSITGHAAMYRAFGIAGWDSFAVEYPGYAGSGGAPGQTSLVSAGQAAWDWLLAQGYAPNRIAVWGLSLGGGVAAQLVAGPADPCALILESTFASVTLLAQQRAPLWPVELILRHPFDTLAVANRLQVPVMVIHARDDGTIPIDLGGRPLAREIPGAIYVELEGFGHSGQAFLQDPAVQARVLGFLEAAGTAEDAEIND